MSKLELGDLKNIIKISNRLSEEQIGKILNELKEDPNFVVDIDKSLSDTLLKFNKLYGDESISKVKFVIDQYGKFNDEKVTTGGDPTLVVTQSPKSTKKSTQQKAADVAATIGAFGAAAGQAFRSFWPQTNYPVQQTQAQANPFELTVDTLLKNITANIQQGKETETYRQLLALLTMNPDMVKSRIHKMFPDLVQPVNLQGIPYVPVGGTVTTLDHVGTVASKNDVNTMDLLSRHGYLAQTPVYPGSFQQLGNQSFGNQLFGNQSFGNQSFGKMVVPQFGGNVDNYPDEDFKIELNENEDGLTTIPVVNIGGAIRSLDTLPTMDITFDGMIGGGRGIENPTIYLAEGAEGMIGVPTYMDLFGLQEEANLIGGANDDDEELTDLKLSDNDDEDEDDDDELKKMKQAIESDSDEERVRGSDEGSLFSDELYTLSDVSLSD